MLDPFTNHCAGSMKDESCDGCIGSAMTFQESFDKDSVYGNDEF